MEKRNSQRLHRPAMEQTTGLFRMCASVWYAVNHNTSVTSGK